MLAEKPVRPEESTASGYVNSSRPTVFGGTIGEILALVAEDDEKIIEEIIVK